MGRTERLREITHLTSFGIFLVVLGHSYCTLDVKNEPVTDALYWLRNAIYSFHMPLFMFISGLLFHHTNQLKPRVEYIPFVRKKAMRLLVPYVVISTAAFPVKAGLSAYAWRHTTLSINDYLKSLVYPNDNVIFFFWFLPMLFLIFLAAPALLKCIKGNRAGIYAAAVSAALIVLNVGDPFRHTDWLQHGRLFNMAGAAKYAIYFWLGCIFHRWKDRPALLPRLPVFAGALVSLILLNAVKKTVFHGNVPMLNVKIFITAVVGIVMSYYLMLYYTGKNLNLFRYIDGYSYQIYLMSWFPQVFFRVLIYQVMGLGFYVTFILMLCSGLIIPVVAAKLAARRLPRAGFIIGLEQRKSSGAG